MINLKDHVVIRQDIEYVPLDIAEAAVAQAIDANRLDQAMNKVQESIQEMNNSLNEALRDD
tara:strand:+ start:124 stop:306 length:183 start_codon:yes stop_codon:yes gene_type:complete